MLAENLAERELAGEVIDDDDPVLTRLAASISLERYGVNVVNVDRLPSSLIPEWTSAEQVHEEMAEAAWGCGARMGLSLDGLLASCDAAYSLRPERTRSRCSGLATKVSMTLKVCSRKC